MSRFKAIKLIGSVYLTRWFFVLMGLVVLLFCLSFGWDMLFPVAQTVLAVVIIATIIDVALLYTSKGSQVLTGSRKMPKLLSLGDDNTIHLTIKNNGPLRLNLEVIDELPVQLQIRDFKLTSTIQSGESQLLNYTIHPNYRGEYKFGKLRVFAASLLGIGQRRFTICGEEVVPVYPSIIQMKQFELKAFSRVSHQEGIKRTRRIGHSYEFEQIKNYVQGDDYRSINWKATGRRGDLMVNQYEDERAQQVYCVIDKSRSMRMPFGGLSLLDHAINTSLVISNIALLKHDKAGLMSFSDKLGNLVKADRKRNQLKLIMEALYRQQERQIEANYELLYLGVRNMIKGRSLLFLFTNFESAYSMERVMPILRRLNKLHLLVVVFFENTEMADYMHTPSENVEDIYYHTIAESVVTEKRQIVSELRQYGIQCILTRPEQLSLNTVNKYLELKSRGLI